MEARAQKRGEQRVSDQGLLEFIVDFCFHLLFIILFFIFFFYFYNSGWKSIKAVAGGLGRWLINGLTQVGKPSSEQKLKPWLRNQQGH